jgi:hypothetical protein
MVTFVVLANGLIGVVCLFVALKIWQFRRKLAQITETMLMVERVIHRALNPAPNAILKAKGGTYRLRQNYERLGIQIQKIEGLLVLFRLGEIVWQRRRFLSYGTNLARRVSGKR